MVTAAVSILLVGAMAQADIPLMINHQGLAKVDGVPFTGNGLFKFGFVAADDTWLWTNDGTHLGESVGAAPPDAAVIIAVNNGIYHVRLGDTSLTNMVAIPSGVFDDDDVKLRVIFDDGEQGEQVLDPDQAVTSTPYAYHAADADKVGGKTASELIPTGVIVMWSGTIATIPSGWALCDGTNGTPDLRDRFIVGARQDDSGVAKTNVKGTLLQTGGEHQHTLTTGEMPSHSHDIPRRSPTVGSWRTFDSPDELNIGIWGNPTGSTGGDQPHENTPPFYALAFIIKL